MQHGAGELSFVFGKGWVRLLSQGNKGAIPSRSNDSGVGPSLLGNNMKRFIAVSLAACIAFILCACDRTEFEKKSERDADARRAVNTKPKSPGY
jgi:hypothetical protein